MARDELMRLLPKAIKSTSIFDSASNYHKLKDHIITYLRIPNSIKWEIDNSNYQPIKFEAVNTW